MASRERPYIRRVVVSFFEPGAAAPTVIAVATEFARVLHAELLGLFIEDALLFEAAEFSLLRTIEPRQLVWRSLSVAQLIEANTLAARGVERRLLREANASGIAARFEVVRGEPAGVLARLSEPSDLLVIAEPADPIACALPPYPRFAQAALAASAAALFVPRRTRRLAGPVVALARGPDDPALALGAALAAALREQLIVLAEGTPEEQDDIARAARRAAGGGCVTLGLGALSARSWLAALRQALRSYRERLLILSRGAAEDAAPYFDLASERGVPLLMVGT